MNERICWLWVPSQWRLVVTWETVDWCGERDECALLFLLSERLADPLLPVQAGMDLYEPHVISV